MWWPLWTCDKIFKRERQTERETERERHTHTVGMWVCVYRIISHWKTLPLFIVTLKESNDLSPSPSLPPPLSHPLKSLLHFLPATSRAFTIGNYDVHSQSKQNLEVCVCVCVYPCLFVIVSFLFIILILSPCHHNVVVLWIVCFCFGSVVVYFIIHSCIHSILTES